jgi:small subunit ribosomal protein S13
MSSRGFRHIVRIAGFDIDGSKKLVYGLTKIRGVGVSLSNAIVKTAGLKPEMRVGNLTDSEVEKIENIIEDPAKYGLPSRMYNRRKDVETGRDIHLVGPDLALRVKADIDFMKEIKSWKGIRHSLGLKVRGQRTRTTGRMGKAVGVRKRLVLAAARAAEREKEKK